MIADIVKFLVHSYDDTAKPRFVFTGIVLCYSQVVRIAFITKYPKLLNMLRIALLPIFFVMMLTSQGTYQH